MVHDDVHRTPITFAQLAAKVRWLAACNPDYVYPKLQKPSRRDGHLINTCVYNSTETQPGCIFGQAFEELGHPVPEEFEGDSISGVLYEMLANADELTSAQISWADKVQMCQDHGKPWRLCIAQADELAEGV